MKRFLSFVKYTLIGLSCLLGIVFIVYILGPKPAKPAFSKPDFAIAQSLTELEQSVIESEKNIPYIKPDNEAHILWADSLNKKKTSIALLFLHGFGASHKEGYPVTHQLAQTFGCNMYLARLAEHGKDEGDNNMINFTAEDYYDSGEKALHIAQQLGDSVVIIGNSGGGAMALFLASRHPEVKGLITYSPAVRVFRKDAQLMSEPWGLQIAHFVTGKEHNDWVFRRSEQKRFWTNHQRFEAIVQFTTFQKYAMTPETFRKIKCPLFVGYYYENEENQDKTVSVAAMREMLTEVSTPQYQKREMNFPTTKAHVMISDLTSDDWQSVVTETKKFMQEILGMTPAR